MPWPAGGESEPDNLGPACTGHHQFKHSPGAQLIQINPGGFGWLYDDTRYISANDLPIDHLGGRH